MYGRYGRQDGRMSSPKSHRKFSYQISGRRCRMAHLTFFTLVPFVRSSISTLHCRAAHCRRVAHFKIHGFSLLASSLKTTSQLQLETVNLKVRLPSPNFLGMVVLF